MPSRLSVTGGRSPGGSLFSSFSEEYEEAWRSDPSLRHALKGLVASVVTSALFGVDNLDECPCSIAGSSSQTLPLHPLEQHLDGEDVLCLITASSSRSIKKDSEDGGAGEYEHAGGSGRRGVSSLDQYGGPGGSAVGLEQHGGSASGQELPSPFHTFSAQLFAMMPSPFRSTAERFLEGIRPISVRKQPPSVQQQALQHQHTYPCQHLVQPQIPPYGLVQLASNHSSSIMI